MHVSFSKALKFTFSLIACLLFNQFSYSQLSNFTLQVVPTNETCTANGVLNFTVSGTTSGSSIDYRIYLLPNVTTPIATLTANLLSGLNAGNYRVIATQSLNGNSGTQQKDVVINNLIQPLTYSLIGTKAKCGNDGKIIVTVTSGNPITYQIISGPVVVAAQASNVFLNLPSGIYQIRVFDNCGDAVVQTFTLLQASVSLIIDPVDFSSGPLPSCNTIAVSNFFGVLSGNEIAFPLTFQYSIFPPGGGTPLIQTLIVNSGSTAEEIIPFYYNQSYYFNLKVTDACGNIYNRNNNVVNKKLDLTSTVIRLNCNDIALKLAPNFFVAPYTINYLSYPAGFNPTVFNAGHPGPFSSDFVTYGTVGNSFPLGNYSIQVTDACGRTVIKNVIVIPQNPTPVAVGSNNGCGQVSITIMGIQLVSVVITAAPSTYSFSLPKDVSNLINTTTNQFNIVGLPEGTYTFQITDSCGIIHTLQSSVLPYTPLPLSIINRSGCENGFGSVRLNSTEGIVSVILINAPPAFTGSFPVNLSANIVGGSFYFADVPEGNYTFLLQNTCGAQRTEIIAISGYQVITNTVNPTENCGSFNLFLQHVSNGSFQQQFWLQKLNPLTNTWGHPGTNLPYLNGTVPNSQNSIFINNNANNLNLAYNGQFRILKFFQTYSNQGTFVNCIKAIKTFEISQGPKIINVYSFGCSNGNNEVIVEAIGIPPLSYSITTKNGLPFLINNGIQNTFSNLTPGIYNFQVRDVCGNIVNSLYDITAVAPITIQSSVFCNGQNASLSVSPFSFLNYEWWKDNNNTTILSTSNSLQFLPFNQATDFGIYHVRISDPNNSVSCINLVLDYQIASNLNSPNAGQGMTVSYCGNQGIINLVTLLGGSPDNFGTWQEITNSGTLNNNLWNSSTVLPGTYQFTYKVNGLCNIFDESLINITLKPIPAIPVASVNSTVCDTQMLVLNTAAVANATYFWTGPNGFMSNDQNPEISNLSAQNNGTYTVKVVVNGCESGVGFVEVNVSPLPQFTFESYCSENAFAVLATPILNSFDVNSVTYSWTGPNGFMSAENPIDITRKPGTYTLVVTNAQGCSTTNFIELTNTLCAIPLGISPNGDGSNDTFDLSGFDVLKLEIFSRYGRIVYQQDNYTNQWHGQDFKNDELPDATYYYYIRLKTGEEKTGWVYVTR